MKIGWPGTAEKKRRREKKGGERGAGGRLGLLGGTGREGKGRKRKAIAWAGALLALLLTAAAVSLSGREEDAGVLKRPPKGEEELKEVLVKGLLPEELLMEITVPGRDYTGKEALEIYERLMEELPERILGENESLSQVRSSLDLVSRDEEYGIEIRWETEDADVLDTRGQLYNEGLPEEGRELWLRATLTDGEHPETYQFKIHVLPPDLTEEERLRSGLLEAVEKADQEQRHSPVLELPPEYEGRPLSYRLPVKSSIGGTALLGAAGAGLLLVKERGREKERLEKRKAQMRLDYPEILSKFIIFLGAGMTVPTAWEQIVGDYRRHLKEGNGRRRWAYEEMAETSRQLKQGVSEGQAYREFGRRCGLWQYTRLCGLLEQNRKNGSKNLRERLSYEMSEAFEQRKHGARRLGEEASTKLLIPLFLMLGVVMVMIAVPAMMEFM